MPEYGPTLKSWTGRPIRRAHDIKNYLVKYEIIPESEEISLRRLFLHL